jgi:DNA-binding transcriptional MerR regulator
MDDAAVGRVYLELQQATVDIARLEPQLEEARERRLRGIDEGRKAGLTLAQIGRILGISPQRVMDLHKSWLEKQVEKQTAAVETVTATREDLALQAKLATLESEKPKRTRKKP